MWNQDKTMKKLMKKLLKIVLPILFGVLILVWVYRDFDFARAAQVAMHEMNWSWMILSLVFGIFSHVFRGWRWKLTLAPLDAHPRTRNCVNAIFMAYAANLVLPRVGEISRCGVLARYDGVPFAKSLGTVVTERLIDSLCVGMITIAALVVQMSVFDRFFEETGTDFGSLAGLFTSVHFYIILACIIGILVLLFFILRALSFYQKIKGIINNVWEGIISLRRVRNIPLFMGYTVLIWFCYFMQFYITFYCFGFTAGLGVLAGLVLFVAGSIAVVVPTPNGAGPWHFAIISMMGLYGVELSQAGIFALIVHGVQTFLVILLGIYAMLALPIINKKKIL